MVRTDTRSKQRLTVDTADGSQYYEKTGDEGFAKYSAPADSGGESVS